MAKKDKLAVLATELEKNLDMQESIKAELVPLQEVEAKIREELILGMGQRGLRFVRTESGLGFGIQERKTLSIKEGMEDKAMSWAKENYEHILTISKPAMNKILKPMLEFPDFIEEQVTRYLSVRQTEADE